MSEIIKTIILTLTSIIVLFILTKIMGYRQMSQLSMFDYINGITIGSIAAEMSTSVADNFMEPLIAMIIYALVGVLLSLLSIKSIVLRRFINGKSMILYKDGALYYKNLKKSKIDLQEFLIRCRCSGFFDLSQLKLVILEPNGQMSFIPIATHRPLMTADMNIEPVTESYCINIIMDGKILEANLKQTGNNMNWLNKKLKENKIKDIRSVTLATCSIDNQFSFFCADNSEIKNDNFI